MRSRGFVRGTVISLATLGMCLPQVAFAVAPTPMPIIVDVALSDGGVLHGQVIDTQGSGVAGIPVSVKAQDREVAKTTTAPDGTFGIQGLRGGVHQVATAQGQGVYRLWSAGTAPPVAQTSAILHAQNGVVNSKDVVYTQGGGAFAPKMLLANPIVIAGVVATAVAVPVALANSRPASP